MRGDSLRDLYAKTLAVVGLGLLAAAGAIVDYWPVGGALPIVPALTALRPSLPAAVQLQSDIQAPRAVRSIRVSLSTDRAFSTSLRTVKFAEVAPPVSRPLEETAPIPDAAFVRVDENSAEWLAAMTVEVDLLPPPDPLAVYAQPEPGWSFSGAMRRTRASIKDARSFLGTKLVGVVGAFRKVSPFWDTTTITQLR